MKNLRTILIIIVFILFASCVDDEKEHKDIILNKENTEQEKVMNKVTYNYGYNCFKNKEALRKSFYNEFYLFLKNKTDFDFSSINVSDSTDFYNFCIDWNALGKSDLYGPGDTLKQYYLTDITDGKVEDQPTDTFVGHCYQQGKFVTFLEFLPTFFDYWRTDEGCTCYGEHTTDFFYRSWDALVDTLKYFYFTSDTLNIKYPWFKSDRVKHALDNFPGLCDVVESDTFTGTFSLPSDVTLDGFTFLGWYEEEQFINKITTVSSTTTVYAKWQRNK